jgi:hypothetical protein
VRALRSRTASQAKGSQRDEEVGGDPEVEHADPAGYIVVDGEGRYEAGGDCCEDHEFGEARVRGIKAQRSCSG